MCDFYAHTRVYYLHPGMSTRRLDCRYLAGMVEWVSRRLLNRKRHSELTATARVLLVECGDVHLITIQEWAIACHSLQLHSTHRPKALRHSSTVPIRLPWRIFSSPLATVTTSISAPAAIPLCPFRSRRSSMIWNPIWKLWRYIFNPWTGFLVLFF